MKKNLNKVLLIKAFDKNCYDEVTKLLQETITNTFKKEGILQSYKEDLQKELQTQIEVLKKSQEQFLVAKKNNKIIGIITYGEPNQIIKSNIKQPDQLSEIKSAYILPEYQKQGIGRLLLQEILVQMNEEGIKRYCLDCGYKSSVGFWKELLGECTIQLENYWGKDNHHMIWLGNIAQTLDRISIKFDFDKFPVLETERLILREINITDHPAIIELQTDPEVNKFIDRPRRDTKEKAISFIEFLRDKHKKRLSLLWTITFGECIVGTICLWNQKKLRGKLYAEVGYELLPKYHGNGIMSEALFKLITYASQDLNIHVFEAFTNVRNKASIHLLERSNFQKVGEIKEQRRFGDGYATLAIYQLTN